ncbi:GtrA family protein [Romboutsia sedimentorum]|uniref:GtrA family protein n=1 Tax=Romboutsia sedimentorum TaxID=1368474 RepID=A0ABT7E7M2_9FIRM|nr:GtrA family protein [Romboutsia sedimentorum]MDK2562934.1 GtrA family protein [Romboutsia sedimentorum]MDK2586358.1 GtrA family protein [Romboutsia sedimentorum]
MNSLLNVYTKYKEVILYLVFGVLTTIVSFVSYYFCSDILQIHYLISNIISWVLAVAFAYVTNRIWVFESKSNSLSAMLKEMFTFVNCRLLSGVIDMGVMFLLVDALHLNDLYAKLFTQVIVVVLNYIFSKLIIFKT